MNSIQVNAYAPSAATTTAKNKSSMDMNDFMQLLAAQMANQDVLNPMQDTEYMSQLASYTSLQAMQELLANSNLQLEALSSLSQISYMQYGSSMLGKTVLVATVDDNGVYTEKQGVLQSLNLADNGFTVTVDGKSYPLNAVMKVLA